VPHLLIYILRRLGLGILSLIGLSMLIFVISRVIPGDPARLALGQIATKEAVENLRQEMHLDEPIYKQYYYWIKAVLKGDFGKSLFTGRPVIVDIRKTFPATLELTMWAVIFSVIIGQLLGITAARYHGKWLDNIARIIAYIGIITPNFVLAIVLLLIFGMKLDLLPGVGRLTPGTAPPASITGIYTIDALFRLRFDLFWDALKHVALPAISMGWVSLAQESRITRANMISNMTTDYISSDKSFGFPTRVIFLKYLLKPSLVPTISIMGPDLAVIMVHAFLVEQIYNFPGFARYGLQTIISKDLNAVVVVIIIFGIIFVIANIISDLVVSILDPRIRFRRGL